MTRTLGYASLFAALLAACQQPQQPFGNPGRQGSTMIAYECDLGGEPGRLTATVETISDPTGTTYIYGGELVSRTARYSFTGRDAFADFVDLNGNQRFRVQFISQGDALTLIANPESPGRVQYQCRRAQ